VVSKESLDSKHVEPEWRRAVECKKRIILIIFEAVPLPKELQNCEWLDFRTKYSKRMKELVALLEKDPRGIKNRESETGFKAAPQSGFKAPKRFWLALILSVVVIIGSLPVWWTLFVPFILVPLPWQLYKRNYIYSRVIPALLLLPVIFMFTYVAFFFDTNSVFHPIMKFADNWSVTAGMASWALAGLLMTPVMQRRAMPEAARTRFANPLVIQVKQPRSVSFVIDHAPEDGRYADDLRRGLERHGHRLIGENETPEAVFVLISCYKKASRYNPDDHAVYPILLQAVDDLDPALSRIQWIDFRNGIRSINKLAKLLPEPERMLKALAVPPTGAQEVFPLAVGALQFFYLITGILSGGGMLTTMLSLGLLVIRGDLSTGELLRLIILTINGLVLLGTVTFSVSALRLRTGGASALYPLLVLTVFQVLIQISVFMNLMPKTNASDTVYQALSATAQGTLYSGFAFLLGLIILIPILLFRWRDVYRWLPRRQDLSVSRLESLLLLYTPKRQRALIFHLLFHALVLVTYLLLNIITALESGWAAFCIVIPFALIAMGIRWLARKVGQVV
jgi:hypothetical protein